MTTPEADHVLVIFDPGDRVREEERSIRKMYGPLTKAGAEQLARVLNEVATVYFEVVPFEKPPLMLTDAGRQVAQRRIT